MHDFGVLPIGVAVPEEGSVGGEFIDAAVAKVDVVIVFDLADEFDDFSMEFYLEKRKSVVEFAPVRVGHLWA